MVCRMSLARDKTCVIYCQASRSKLKEIMLNWMAQEVLWNLSREIIKIVLHQIFPAKTSKKILNINLLVVRNWIIIFIDGIPAEI